MEFSEKIHLAPHILIVDDVEVNREILQAMIEGMGCVPMCASGAADAAALMRRQMPQLILLDIFMPEINGYEFCERLKESPVTRDIPVIFISAADSSEDKRKGLGLGAVDYIAKPFEVAEVTMRVRTHLKLYEMQRELEQSNQRLHSVINSQAQRIEEEQKNILYALATVAAGGDASMTDHLHNVSFNCRMLSQALQFSPDFEEDVSQNFIDTIAVAARLHDIGKLRTPDVIRRRPDGVEEEEMELVRCHVDQGVEMLERIYENAQNNGFLPMAIEIARCHHARWDGTGYPRGIRGKEIPLSARITAVADVYDTLTRDGYGGAGCSLKEGRKRMEEGTGRFFDPQIMTVFQKIERRLKHS